MKQLILNIFLIIINLSLISTGLIAQVQLGGDIDGKDSLDYSGQSVSMPDTRTVAIGAAGGHSFANRSGKLRVYKWTNSSWVQKGIDITGVDTNDYFGYCVSMPDSNTVAVGAPQGYSSDTGYVRIYRWNGSSWSQKGLNIKGDSTGGFNGFGRSVSMPDSNTIAIGAIRGSLQGQVKVYRWTGSLWAQKGVSIDGDVNYDQAGHSVSMPDSNTVAIGAPKNDGNGNLSGHVRIYKWNGTSWSRKGGDIDGEAAGDQSGHSINMPNANTIAIGAIRNGGNGYLSGHTRIYSWNGSNWIQKGGDIDGEASNDQAGHSVSMPDSNTIAIGVPKNDGNGSSSGHVRIYTWNGSSWEKKGGDIDGENIADQSGYSVSMPNMNTVSIGAFNNNGNGRGAGHVRVYSLCVTFATDTVVACDSITWIDGNTYAKNDTISKYSLINAEGCDSIVTLHLTIKRSTSSIDSVVACDSYTWINSKTYTSSNSTAKDTLVNAAGCDSIVTLNLTINKTTYATDVVNACDSYTWINSKTYTSSNSTAKDTLVNAVGCDSIVTLNLTINKVDAFSVSVEGAIATASEIEGNYQWIDCENNFQPIENETGHNYAAKKNGFYAVIVLQGNCRDTSNCLEINTVSILEPRFNQDFKVYPNPSTGSVQVEFNAVQQEVKVLLFSLKGELLNSSTHLQATKIALEIKESQGVYFLKIINESEIVSVVRLVKQ